MSGGDGKNYGQNPANLEDSVPEAPRQVSRIPDREAGKVPFLRLREDL